MKLIIIFVLLLSGAQHISSQVNPFLSPRTQQSAPIGGSESDLVPIPIPMDQLYGTDGEDLTQQQISPFGLVGGVSPIFQRILEIQISLSRVMSDTLISFQDERNLGLVVLLLGITFLFGIIHTLGVGHRKTVLIGWIIHSTPSYLQIISAAVLLGIFHTLGTGIILLIASIIRDLVGGTLLQTREVVQIWANFLSGIVVFILGMYLVKKSWGHSHMPGSAAHHSHTHTHGLTDSHQEHSNCSCGNHQEVLSDLDDKDEYVDLGDRKTLWMVAGSMGLVPCPGSLSVLAVSFLLGDLVLGLLAVGIISLGTIFTLGMIGITLRFFVGKAMTLSQKSFRLAKIFDITMQVIQVGAAIVVLTYGGMLTLGSVLTLFF
jgi:nickel/cobalt exporter